MDNWWGRNSFSFCGILLIIKSQKLGQFFAAITTISITTICAWVSLLGDSEHFESDSLFFSKEMDVLIARILFGLVAVMGTAIVINGLYKISSLHKR